MYALLDMIVQGLVATNYPGNYTPHNKEWIRPFVGSYPSLDIVPYQVPIQDFPEVVYRKKATSTWSLDDLAKTMPYLVSMRPDAYKPRTTVLEVIEPPSANVSNFEEMALDQIEELASPGSAMEISSFINEPLLQQPGKRSASPIGNVQKVPKLGEPPSRLQLPERPSKRPVSTPTEPTPKGPRLGAAPPSLELPVRPPKRPISTPTEAIAKAPRLGPAPPQLELPTRPPKRPVSTPTGPPAKTARTGNAPSRLEIPTRPKKRPLSTPTAPSPKAPRLDTSRPRPPPINTNVPAVRGPTRRRVRERMGKDFSMESDIPARRSTRMN